MVVPHRTRVNTESYTLTKNHPTLFPNQQLIPKGSQTADDHEHGCYNSCTLCRGLCPVLMHSDLITFQRLENLYVAMPTKAQAHFLGCAARRLLHAFANIYLM
jgi:hypothetical protein